MSDSVLASLTHLLHRASQYADDRFAAACGDDTVTARQLVVLKIVSENERPSQIDICERSGIDRSTLADMMRRLVARGLITRRRTREDARRYALKLTDEGHKVLQRSQPYLRAADAALVAALSPQQRQSLSNTLQLIIDASTATSAEKA